MMGSTLGSTAVHLIGVGALTLLAYTKTAILVRKCTWLLADQQGTGTSATVVVYRLGLLWIRQRRCSQKSLIGNGH